jgi:enoyl-CoA hydratase/carnithine racemase
MVSKSKDALISGTRAVRVSQETTLEQGLEEESTIFSWLFGRKGVKEGTTAFV